MSRLFLFVSPVSLRRSFFFRKALGFFLFSCVLISALNGMSYFKAPQMVGDGTVAVEVSVVNGPKVEIEIRSNIEVLATPFSSAHPQLMLVDSSPVKIEGLAEDTISEDERIFWDIAYELLGSGDWFARDLPASRRLILLALITALLMALLLRPKIMIWGLCVFGLLGFLALPDYQRQVLFVGKDQPYLIGLKMDDLPDLVIRQNSRQLLLKKVDFSGAETLNESFEEKEMHVFRHTKVKGLFRGFWSEILVIESLEKD